MKKITSLTFSFLMVFILSFTTAKAENDTIEAIRLLKDLPFTMGLGTGQLTINGQTIEDVFNANEDFVVNDPFYITLGVSGKVTDDVHISGEFGFFNQSAQPKVIDLGAGSESALYSHRLLSLVLSISYFPTGNGLFLKAGIGACSMDSAIEYYIYEVDRTNIHETFSGSTAVFGGGFDIIGETLHVGIYVEYSRQSYDDTYDDEGILQDNSDIYSDLYTCYVRFGWYQRFGFKNNLVHPLIDVRQIDGIKDAPVINFTGEFELNDTMELISP